MVGSAVPVLAFIAVRAWASVKSGGVIVHIGLMEMGQVYWSYETTGSDILNFRFYDGRVIDMDWN